MRFPGTAQVPKPETWGIRAVELRLLERPLQLWVEAQFRLVT